MNNNVNNQVLHDLIMQTITNVQELATQVAEINSLLKNSVENNNKKLEERATRQRNDINLLRDRIIALENSRNYTIKTLGFLKWTVGAIMIPIAVLFIETYLKN
ncbi:hypothetical protein [Megamonas hypermegale]|uniref:hypothetical protein n=1 Tax=Megamonas hypermegale TaxID=158847 RepID=UPI001956A9A9|nr:hypothetical protein [Megamonas hypermegale]MBM6761848.1 hypothetical protein [Megamonas hypermegale]